MCVREIERGEGGVRGERGCKREEWPCGFS